MDEADEVINMKLKAVIFDLDGVIVFTDKFHYKAWKVVADKLPVFFDETINNRLRGVSRMDSLEIILEKYEGKTLTLQEKESLASEKNDIYRQLLLEMSETDVSQEVRDTLAEIRKRGYKIALGSSSKNAKFILHQVGLIEAFDVVSDGNNISKSKPDPEVFVKAADYLDIDYTNCLVVEDAMAGIEAGKSAAMTTAAIGDATKCNKADYNLEKFKDLLNILK
jgi:beta-phosphoglucomutase